MFKIIVDSGCDLTPDMKKDIVSVPLNIEIDNHKYVDDKTIDTEKLLEAMENSPNACKTSAPSPELYLDAYKGEDDVFAVTISSKLSGSYNSAVVAKQMYLDELGQKFIHVFDSLSASVGETLIALKIKEFAKLDFSYDDIIKSVNDFIKNMNTFFILDKFDNLVKNGRMNPYIAKLASIFSIRPICFADDGKIAMLDKARGYDKAVQKLIDIIANKINDSENRVLGITHVKCLEKALAFKEKILQHMNFKDVVITEATGLCTAYANRNGIIVVC